MTRGLRDHEPNPEAATAGRPRDRPHRPTGQRALHRLRGVLGHPAATRGGHNHPRGRAILLRRLRHTAAGIRAHATRWVAAILLLLATVCSAWLLTPQPANNRPPGHPRTPPAKSAGVRSHRHQGLTANTPARQPSRRATPPRRAPQTRPTQPRPRQQAQATRRLPRPRATLNNRRHPLLPHSHRRPAAGAVNRSREAPSRHETTAGRSTIGVRRANQHPLDGCRMSFPSASL